MIDIFDPKLLGYIQKNYRAFILIASISANVYQYFDIKGIIAQDNGDKRELNDKIQSLQKEEIQYQRVVSEKDQLLLDELIKPANNDKK